MQARTDRKSDGTDFVMSPPGEIHLVFAWGGQATASMSSALTPKDEVIREMLLSLRRQHRWSQGFAAAVLGVSVSTLVKWESGKRNPNGSARKLVFLLYGQLVDKSIVKNCWDLAFWGRFPCRGPEDGCELQVSGTYFVPEKVVLPLIETVAEAAPQAANQLSPKSHPTETLSARAIAETS
jgi:DNA-binding transcriptional regulator YiaG